MMCPIFLLRILRSFLPSEDLARLQLLNDRKLTTLYVGQRSIYYKAIYGLLNRRCHYNASLSSVAVW